MRHSREIPASPNLDVADRLDEVARIFAQQGANRFRVRAYRHAAGVLRGWPRSVADIFAEEGIEGRGDSGHRAEHCAFDSRHSSARPTRHARPAARRRRSGSHPRFGPGHRENIRVAVARRSRHRNAGGTGSRSARRALGKLSRHWCETSGRHSRSLAQRLRRVRRERPRPAAPTSVSELLDVDREYREKAAAGILTKVAPRRFNPEGEAWLPILHTARKQRHYTAVFSNTARAHELGKTHDWVVLFCDNGATRIASPSSRPSLALCRESASSPAAKRNARNYSAEQQSDLRGAAACGRRAAASR